MVKFKNIMIPQVLTEGLCLKDGVWFSRKSIKVSYPNIDNKLYAEIENYSFWFIHRNRCIASLVRRFNSKNILFDIGGGNGVVSANLDEIGIETVLVEPSKKTLAIAKRRGVKNLVCAPLEGLTFPKNSINAVGIFRTYMFSFLPVPIFLFRSLPFKIFHLTMNHVDVIKNKYKTKPNLFKYLINKLCKWEERRIRKLKSIPFGSSCFVVAQKYD